jgi:hypothetical protein
MGVTEEPRDRLEPEPEPLAPSQEGDGTLAPKSPTDADQPDTRLCSLIAEARRARGQGSSSEQRDRALADREFSQIADAIEHGLRTVDPRSADAAVLERLRDAVRGR